MRVYEGSPRRDYEEVLRCIGADLDQRRMRDVLLVEVPEGFVVQGVTTKQEGAVWSEAIGRELKETIAYGDEEIATLLDAAVGKRRTNGAQSPMAGRNEAAFRVLGSYIDSVKPYDVCFFEQEGSYVLRTLSPSPGGLRHALAEFTRDDVEGLILSGPSRRGPARSEAEPGT